MRVAVQARFAEIREPRAPLAEPLVEALHLALAEARDAGDLAGEAPVARLGLGGDQVLDAELARDRPRDEAVGRGDDGAQVAGRLVAANQLARRRADHRPHAA